MTDSKNASLPTTRVSRLSRFTRLVGRVAGGMAAEGVRQIANGNIPQMQQMILTPGNARRLTSELQKLRGAAMKLGQILSMDAGSFIPQELADILAQLRADAHFMPAKQLSGQLEAAYGSGWKKRFREFESKPIAAASIGQVHRATTFEGDELALKIQYPGIRDSIDSDVQNLYSLLRVTNLLPANLELQPVLDEVKLQLHDEANYLLEAENLRAFGELLQGDSRFLVPRWWQDYSTEQVLAMDFVSSEPIESVAAFSQEKRDEILAALFELMFHELFELNLMQTDANFANYRYCHQRQKIVLLDFGATRGFATDFDENYLQLIRALYENDDKGILAAAKSIGYLPKATSAGYQRLLVDIFKVIGEVYLSDAPYDFKQSSLWGRFNEINDAMMEFKNDWSTPPIDALYFHRKLGGVCMLAAKLDARVAVRPLIEPYF